MFDADPQLHQRGDHHRVSSLSSAPVSSDSPSAKAAQTRARLVMLFDRVGGSKRKSVHRAEFQAGHGYPQKVTCIIPVTTLFRNPSPSGLRVESRGGAVALGLRFHLPLIEPDGRISRIRLSDKDF